ncbi:MAG: cache domain-containing protein, partial [Chloroflexota bacterium]
MSDSMDITSQTINKGAQRTILFRILGATVILLITSLIFYPPVTWQETVILVATIALVLANVSAFFLLRKNNPDLSVLLASYSLHLTLLIIGLFVEGIGLSLGMMLLIINVTLTSTLTSSFSSSEKISRQALISAILSSLIIIMIDAIGEELSFRIAVENINTIQQYGLIITLVLIALNFRQLLLVFSQISLRWKLLVSFALITMSAVGLQAFITNQITENALTLEANEALFAAASQTEDALKDFINNNLGAIRTESRLPIFMNFLQFKDIERKNNEFEQEVINTLIALQEKDTTHITSYALLDLNGKNIVDTSMSDMGSNKSERGYFIAAIESKTEFFSPVEISPTTGQGALYFSAPVFDLDNNVLGVLRVRYNAVILQNLLARSNDLVGEDSFGVLFDENHLHLAHGIAPETTFQTVMPLDDATFQLLKDTLRIPQLPAEDLFLELPELEMHLV